MAILWLNEKMEATHAESCNIQNFKISEAQMLTLPRSLLSLIEKI